jgi:uncharacterized membrane protein (DUF106 family)
MMCVSFTGARRVVLCGQGLDSLPADRQFALCIIIIAIIIVIIINTINTIIIS